MSRDPVVLALPPFFGFTRRVVLVSAAVFAATLILGAVAPRADGFLLAHATLQPGEAFRQPWQFLTYSFVTPGLLSVLFAALSVWFFGSALEEARGTRWVREYFFSAAIGGGLLAVLLSLTVFRTTPRLGPDSAMTGLWPVVMALLLAYARLFPDRELSLYFVLKMKAKVLAAVYLLVYLALTIAAGQWLEAMVAVCASLCGFAYMRYAPRAGMGVAGSEGWYGLRNRYDRAKRRRAAKKFTVYMRKQGKDVHLDASGKYVSLEDEKRDSRDRKWMN
jgi:membrane associated rhomboid family serine protease